MNNIPVYRINTLGRRMDQLMITAPQQNKTYQHYEETLVPEIGDPLADSFSMPPGQPRVDTTPHRW